jgi:hypothetical protein
MKQAKNISSNLDAAYLNQTPATTETRPNIEEKTSAEILNRLTMTHALGVATPADLPAPVGTIGKIIFHSMKSSDNEMSLTEIVNNTDGNRSYILLHPTGSFDVFNDAGDHILKSVGNHIVVGQNITIEAAGEVNILSNTEATPLDEIVTVAKLKTYLAGVVDSMGTPIFTTMSPVNVADIGTKNIHVGKTP